MYEAPLKINPRPRRGENIFSSLYRCSTAPHIQYNYAPLVQLVAFSDRSARRSFVRASTGAQGPIYLRHMRSTSMLARLLALLGLLAMASGAPVPGQPAATSTGDKPSWSVWGAAKHFFGLRSTLQAKAEVKKAQAKGETPPTAAPAPANAMPTSWGVDFKKMRETYCKLDANKGELRRLALACARARASLDLKVWSRIDSLPVQANPFARSQSLQQLPNRL